MVLPIYGHLFYILYLDLTNKYWNLMNLIHYVSNLDNKYEQIFNVLALLFVIIYDALLIRECSI